MDIQAVLSKRFGQKIVGPMSMQAAIESLEAGVHSVDFVVCVHDGPGVALLKCLLSVRPELPVILVTEEMSPSNADELLVIPREGFLEFTQPSELESLLQRLDSNGFFHPASTPDSAFARIEVEGLLLVRPLRAAIYLRLAPNRYCMRFKEDDAFDGKDLKEWIQGRGISAFYIRKEQIGLLVDAQSEKLDEVMEDPSASPEDLRSSAASALKVVHDVVSRVGFSKEVQELAKKAAALTLKALGSSPKLSMILSRLKRHEGRYIASHSLMLAEIACAIAHRVGAGSPQVFLKLTMASFLHDLMLEDDTLARVRSLPELERVQPSEEGKESALVRAYRLHPVRAARYAACFDEIPTDVDTILLQHHEQPDGSGFPRGLVHQQMNPLACLFIVAHELLDFYLDTVPSGDRGLVVQAFLNEKKPKFASNTGDFQKIWDSLLADVGAFTN
jgi:hypothetical protein